MRSERAAALAGEIGSEQGKGKGFAFAVAFAFAATQARRRRRAKWSLVRTFKLAPG
jgi:hypothetical protein